MLLTLKSAETAADSGATVQLRILGTVQMVVHGKSVDIGATKTRGLLGVLAYRCNESVSVDYLIDALWGDDRPPDPAKTLKTYVSRLRRGLGDPRCPAWVHTEPRGYRLEGSRSIVDYHQFLALMRAGHRAFGRAEHDTAAGKFSAAVDLWRAPPLADLETAWAHRIRDSLALRDLLPTQSALLETKLLLGEHDVVLDRLPPLQSDHPHDERLAGLWMRALAAANRGSEIAAFYRDFCRRLKADHGVEPGADLVQTYRTIYGRSAHSRPPRTVRIPSAPRGTPGFVGRVDLLNRLDELVLEPGRDAPVVVLDGPPGVGKTALIRRWARMRQDRFPSGILAADLGGYAGTKPIEPGTVLGQFLNELGIPTGEFHGRDVTSRAHLLRTILAGRRILIALDNARNTRHVRPLLDAASNCPVLISSRRRLSGLARDGAEQITVPALSDDETTALLEARIGQRATTEPHAVADLVALCGRLPLAAWIAGEHIATRPAAPLRELVDELRETHRILDAGQHGDDDSVTLRAAFSWSYQALQPSEGLLFRRLGLLPCSRFTVDAATAITGSAKPEVERGLDALIGAHLVERHGAARYLVHDLLRVYAAASAHQDEPRDELQQAQHRLIDWYVETVRTARSKLTADPHDVPPLPNPASATPTTFGTRADAKHWIDLERANLVALVRHAAELEHHEAVWRLAACLNVLNDHDLRELLEVQQFGRASAGQAGRSDAEAGCLTGIGLIHLKLGEHQRAKECFERAHQDFHAIGDTRGEAVALHNLASSHLRLGDPAMAITIRQQALAAFTATNNEWAIANVLRLLGDDHRKLGNHQQASNHYHDALARSRKHAEPTGEAASLARLARLHLDTGQPDHTLEAATTALDIYDRLGDRGGAADALCTLAAAQIKLNAHTDAIPNAAEALRTYEQMRNTAGQATAHELIGRAHHAGGEPKRARAAWTAAAALLAELGDPRSSDLTALADACTEQIPTPRPDSDALTHRVIRGNPRLTEEHTEST